MMRNSSENPPELALVNLVDQTKNPDLQSVRDVTFALAASRPKAVLALANAAFADEKAYYASSQQPLAPERATEELPLEPTKAPRHALEETTEEIAVKHDDPHTRYHEELLAYGVGLGQQVYDERRSAHRTISLASGVVATAAIAGLTYTLFSPLYRTPEDTAHQDQPPQFASQLFYDTEKDITTFSVRVQTEAHPDTEFTAEHEAREEAIVKDGARRIIIDLQMFNIAEISTLHVQAQASSENRSAPNAGLDAPDEQNKDFAVAQAVRGKDDFSEVAEEAKIVVSNLDVNSYETTLNENSIAILAGQAEELGLSIEELIEKYKAGQELSPEATSALAGSLDEKRSVLLSADVKGDYTPHRETEEERKKKLPPLAPLMENTLNSIAVYATGGVLSIAGGALAGSVIGDLGQGRLARWRARRTIKRAEKQAL